MRSVWLRPAALLLPGLVAAQGDPTSRPSSALERLRSQDVEEREAAIAELSRLGKQVLQELERFVFSLDVVDDQPMLQVTWIGFRRDGRLDAVRVPPEALLPADRFASGDDVSETPYESIEDHADDPRHLEFEALWAATSVLKSLGSESIPLLSKMLRDPPRAHAAATLLGRLGSAAVPAVREALGSHEPIVRGEACRVLGLLGPATPDDLLPTLVAALGHDDPRVHKRAAWALARLGDRAVTHLLEELTSTDEMRKARASGTLALLGTKAAPAAEQLLAIGADSHGRARQWALDALGRLGLEGAALDKAVAVLSSQLDGRTDADALTAAEALGRLGVPDARALERLVRCLDSKSEDLRLVATLALGRSSSTTAFTAVKSRLADPATRVRRAAVRSLPSFGTRSLEPLLTYLDGREAPTLDLVAEALCEIGAPAVPGLIAKAQAGNVHVRRVATLALGRLAPGDPNALDALDALLTGEDDPIRLVAIEALGSFGGARAPTALHRLLPLLRDESPYARITAAVAIGRLGAQAKGSVPQLMDALGDEVIDVQIAAAEALAAIGPDARAALCMLRQLATEGPEPLQLAARAAARCVGASPGPGPRPR